MNRTPERLPVPDIRGSALTQSLKDQTEIFEIINSKELETLFQKNTHLLSRISVTQRRNTLLQKELFSLIEEKSRLGLKNHILSDEVSNLKEKLSSFEGKQKLFQQQSLRFKRILSRLKLLQEKDLLKIGSAEKARKTNLEGKLNRYILYRTRVRQAHLALKKRLQEKSRHISYLKLSKQALETKLKTFEQADNQTARRQDRELEALKQNVESLKRALSQQEEGFSAALRASRKKRLDAFKTFERKNSEELKVQSAQIKNLTENLKAKDQDFKAAQNLWGKERSDLNRRLEERTALQKQTEGKMRAAFSERQSRLDDAKRRHEEELTQLNARIQQLSDKENAEQTRKLEALKAGYEARIKNLTEAQDRKLKNIRAETENKLCFEKRRVETLQSEKEKQIKEMEQNMQNLSNRLQQTRIRNQTLEKTHQELSEQVKQEIAAGETLKQQHIQAQELQKDFQEQCKKQNQRVEALQKLNRNLSLQLNRKNQEQTALPPSDPASTQESQENFKKDERSETDFQPPEKDAAPPVEKPKSPAPALPEERAPRHPLADIHFN